MAKNCVDCGRSSEGFRCRSCHGEYLRRQALTETADRDAELLKMVREEKLSGQRIADRLGISKTRALEKVHEATRRDKARAKVSASS